MEKWEGKIAIVTGASAGMGAMISQVLVEKGVKVIFLIFIFLYYFYKDFF